MFAEDDASLRSVPAAPPTTHHGRPQGAVSFRMVPLALVEVSPYQVRRAIGTTGLEHLAVSISRRGVLQPIRVRHKGGRFELIAGERRCRAAQLAGLLEIPALVVTSDDKDSLLDGLIENIHRENLSAADRAYALLRLRQELKLQSWEEVGKAIGVSRQHVHRLLSITRLPDFIREDPRAAALTEKHMRALHLLRNDPGQQVRVWERIHRDHLTGDEALEYSSRVREEADVTRPPTTSQEGSQANLLAAAVSTLVTALETASATDLRVHRRRLRRVVHLLRNALAST